MPPKKTCDNTTAEDRIVKMARRQAAERDKGYRAQALKLYPKLCARCGREFSGANLRELTVHHKDHNHDNNPADGSNWELVSIGYRNEFDASFNEEGELFTYDADMEWDIGLPWYRPTRICP